MAGSRTNRKEQQALIVERDAPLIGAFVVNRVPVGSRVLKQLSQALIDEVTDVGGQVEVLLFSDLQPDRPVAWHPEAPDRRATE
ncbi:MAG: hypothetical protein M3Y48_05710 [Actinomycetota bacterium]|nr:hypothetical protein [Actinomycetota bacterium]